MGGGLPGVPRKPSPAVNQRRAFPRLDVTELRPYLPALEMAERAMSDRADVLSGRMEPYSAGEWRQAREKLEGLRRLIRENGA